MTAPKPCPFCGEAATIQRSLSVLWVCECSNCAVSGPAYRAVEEAVAAWNRLASLPVLVEALAKIEEMGDVVALSADEGDGWNRAAVKAWCMAFDTARAALALAKPRSGEGETT